MYKTDVQNAKCSLVQNAKHNRTIMKKRNIKRTQFSLGNLNRFVPEKFFRAVAVVCFKNIMMKRLTLLALLIIGFLSVSAQEKYTAYADLLGRYKGDFSMKVKARVDFGQNVSFWKQGEMKIVDENGKEMVFNSMIDAMNFMGRRGWRLMQTYAVRGSYETVHHWILAKEVSNDEEIKEGIILRADKPETEITLTYVKRSSKSNSWTEVKTEVRDSLSQEELQAIMDEWKSKSNDATIYDVKISKSKR